MAIWGHNEVNITKDTENRCWIVATPRPPHQHLVTIPWSSAFRAYNPKHYPDLTEAINTCMGSAVTALTRREEDAARHEAVMGAMTSTLPPLSETVQPSTTQRPITKRIEPFDALEKPAPVEPVQYAAKVLSLDDFKRRTKR